MTRHSLLFVRRRRDLASRLILAQDGGTASHVGVRVGDRVIDASLWHGVAQWDLTEWLKGYELVQDVPVIPRSQAAADQAERELFDMLGRRYDWLEIAGFILWRDLGHPDRPVCSRLAQDFFNTATGYDYPGRAGRWGVRLTQVAATSYLHALQH